MKYCLQIKLNHLCFTHGRLRALLKETWQRIVCYVIKSYQRILSIHFKWLKKEAVPLRFGLSALKEMKGAWAKPLLWLHTPGWPGCNLLCGSLKLGGGTVPSLVALNVLLRLGLGQSETVPPKTRIVGTSVDGQVCDNDVGGRTCWVFGKEVGHIRGNLDRKQLGFYTAWQY